MVLESLAFGLFALVTLASSLGVVLVRDVWHSALLLGVALVSVAAHYVMLAAEFVAVIQVLVYVGGVLILVTFGVMLTRREPDEPEPEELEEGEVGA
jgi:NADH-quinone oxidoreductase subunit J